MLATDPTDSAPTSGQPIGSIELLIGAAVAVAADGRERVVVVGDALYEGEVVRVDGQSTVEIRLGDNSLRRLSGDGTSAAKLVLAQNDTASAAVATDAAPALEELTEAVRQAVSENRSFTELLEQAPGETVAAVIAALPADIALAVIEGLPPPAAGGELSDGHTFVVISLDLPQPIPEAGFPTGTFPYSFPEGIEGGGLTEELATLDVLSPSLNISKSASVPGGTANVVGEVVSYTIAVANTGDETLTGVSVSDPFISNLTRVADAVGNGDDLLEVGETWLYTGSQIVTQAQIDAGGTIVNTAKADSDQTPSDSDDSSVTVSQQPSLNVSKSASVPGGTANVAGEVIDYTITVANTGNQTLTGVTVSDPFISNLTRVADTSGDNDNLLEVGETWAYTASHVVTQAEIDAGGSITNLATADSAQTPPDSDGASVTITRQPSLNISKSASVPGGTADAGEAIGYTIAVANTGNQTLTGVTVTDPFINNLARVADTVGDNDNLLEVGETWAYTGSHIVTPAEVAAGGTIDNTATADSDQTGPDTATVGVPVAQQAAPSLSILKSASVPGGTANVAGEVISYTITVANTGNQTLTGVTVSDPFISNLTRVADTSGDNDNLLEVGETWAYTASHVVTQAEIDAGGSIDNIATADSDQTPPDSGGTSVTIAQQPSLNISKSASVPGGTADAGEVISYSIAVANTGNQTLTGVVVSDPLLAGANGTLSATAVETGGTGVNGDGILDVGETWTYAGTYTVAQSDIDNNGIDANGAPDGDGDIDNTASVTSNEAPPQSSTVEVPLARGPSYTVVKTASALDVGPSQVANTNGNGVIDAAGDVIGYEIVVVNTGNQSLTGVVVSDPLLAGANGTLSATAVEAGGTGVNGDGILDVGETWTYAGTYTVAQSDIDNNGIDANGAPDGDGDIDNQASVTTTQLPPPQTTPPVEVPLTQSPSYTIEKTASALDVAGNGVIDAAGDVIGYEIVVANTGNQSLTGVVVSDPLLAGANGTLSATAVETGGTAVNGDGILDVGETWTYAGTYTVAQSDLDNNGIDATGAPDNDGDIDNTASVTSNEAPPQSSTVEVPLAAPLPTLSINDVSVCEGDIGVRNSIITFTVTRAGDTSGVSTVDYQVMSGTAVEGGFNPFGASGDYNDSPLTGLAPLIGRLTFDAGQTTSTITLDITDDRTAIGDRRGTPDPFVETFTIELSSPVNGTLSEAMGGNSSGIAGVGTGSIHDNDKLRESDPPILCGPEFPKTQLFSVSSAPIDFSQARGDILKLSDLITDPAGASANPQGFIQIRPDVSGAVVSVDGDGPSNGSAFVEVATLLGVVSGQVSVLVADHDPLVAVSVA